MRIRLDLGVGMRREENAEFHVSPPLLLIPVQAARAEASSHRSEA
jgi:hypothetical protein